MEFGDDIIDSRDVIDAIEELTQMVADGVADDADIDELAVLRELAEQGEALADWEYGEALIRESYFVAYAQELADDIGAINRDAAWPLTHIDWEGAARDLKMDYTAIEVRGVTYWARS